MALQRSRPGFLFAGAVVFLALPFLFASFSRQPVSAWFVAVGIAIAVLFLALAFQSRRQQRTRADSPPAA